jgi:tripartite-type tricarboxylate transporter receptor subunit TctC
MARLARLKAGCDKTCIDKSGPRKVRRISGRKSMMKGFLTALSITASLLLPGAAVAQGYPDHPVTLIVPTGPGGTTDTLARIYGPAMSKVLGQEVVIENKPGAGNAIGTQLVAEAKPDGYTLGIGANSGLSISPVTTKDIAYDPTEFVPIHYLANVVNILVVNAELGPKTMKDLIALANEKPGELSYSSGGTGTTSHFAGALFPSYAGLSDKTQHVPYEGGSNAAVACAAGEVQFYVGPLASNLLGLIDSGKIIPLAVSGDKRVPILPDVSTFTEAGMPEYTAVAYYGIVGPKGTPDEVVRKVDAAAAEAAKVPEVAKALAEQGIAPFSGTPEDLGKQITKDLEGNRKLLEDSVVKLE